MNGNQSRSARTSIIGALRVRGAGALGGVVEELGSRLQHELELQQLRMAAQAIEG